MATLAERKAAKAAAAETAAKIAEKEQQIESQAPRVSGGRKTKAKKAETPMEHFKRICGGKVGRAKYAIELIGKCTGPGYEHTDQQVEKIENELIEAMDKMLAELKRKLTAGKKDQPKHFVKL